MHSLCLTELKFHVTALWLNCLLNASAPIGGDESAAAPATNAAPTPAAAPAPAPAPTPQPQAAQSGSGRRVPSIHFRHGDRDAIDKEMGVGATAQAGSSGPAPRVPTEVVERPSARFAPKPLSEEEISLIVSGGAEAWN